MCAESFKDRFGWSGGDVCGVTRTMPPCHWRGGAVAEALFTLGSRGEVQLMGHLEEGESREALRRWSGDPASIWRCRSPPEHDPTYYFGCALLSLLVRLLPSPVVQLLALLGVGNPHGGISPETFRDPARLRSRIILEVPEDGESYRVLARCPDNDAIPLLAENPCLPPLPLW